MDEAKPRRSSASRKMARIGAKSSMRTFKDTEGNTVEVPDEAEIVALKEKAQTADKYEQELKELEDKSMGIKSLREANKRKDELTVSLKHQVETLAAEKKKIEDTLKQRDEHIQKQEADGVEILNEDQIKSMAENHTLATLVKLELSRELSGYDKEEQDKVKRYYEKLIAGENVNLDTVHTFIAEAKRVALPNLSSSSVRGTSSGGHAARTEEKKTGFGDTDEGKAFAANMGLRIESPAKK